MPTGSLVISRSEKEALGVYLATLMSQNHEIPIKIPWPQKYWGQYQLQRPEIVR